jgi:hypothetical protein
MKMGSSATLVKKAHHQSHSKTFTRSSSGFLRWIPSSTTSDSQKSQESPFYMREWGVMHFFAELNSKELKVSLQVIKYPTPLMLKQANRAKK